MPLQQDVSHASEFEPSTLTAAGDFDADVYNDADIDVDLDVEAEVESNAVDAAGGALAAGETARTDEIDFAALFGPVASRWEAMLRWYELTAPTVTH